MLIADSTEAAFKSGIYPCINTVLVGDDVRELLGTFSEEEYSGDETAVQGTIEDMPE